MRASAARAAARAGARLASRRRCSRWVYVSTHDWARPGAQLRDGPRRHLAAHARSPAPKPRSSHRAARSCSTARSTSLRPVAVGALLLALAVRRRAARAHRRRRARADDPLGAAPRPRRPRQPLPRPGGVRGHRRRDRQRAGTSASGAAATTSPSRSTGSPTARSASPIAAPALPRAGDPRAARGPLPRRRAASSVDGQPDLGADASCGSRSARPFVLSIQTTRNYEHAFTESLVALLSAHDHETTVQLVLTPAPGFVHRRARRLLKRRERALQHADHRDPGELGIDSVVEAKELKGALELQHRSLYLLRPARHRPRPRRPSAASPASSRQLRSENELAPREMLAAPAPLRARGPQLALPNPLPGCAPACSRRRSSRRSGSSLARASSTRACRARPSGARSRRRDRARRRRESCCSDERGPVSIAPARPQVRPRAHRRPRRRQELGHGPPLRQRRPRPRPRA